MPANNNISDWHDTIHCGDNLPLLQKIPSDSVQLIYIDPPFNTGKVQTRKRIKVTTANGDGDRRGFGGREYKSEVVSEAGYADSFDDYLGFLRPRLLEAYRILAPNGSLFFHIDWRESANCRLLLEEIFGKGDREKGREHCINEIIWAYDYGARSRGRWSAKHDNIYWFAKKPDDYIFNYCDIERVPYMAPDLVGKEKTKKGKTPTDVWWSKKLDDVWWNTIVSPTSGTEKENYPTQKPLAILERIVKVHSNIGDTVLDFFAGSGTTGLAAKRHHRHYILMDSSNDAYDIITKRLGKPTKTTGIFMESVIKQYEAEAKKKKKVEWSDSSFKWMLALPPATKGKVGKNLVRDFLLRKLSISSKNIKNGIQVDGKKIAIKFSMLWDSGVYKFEQIKKEEYDYFFFLGISPSDIHAWVVARNFYEEFSEQHGPDSRWLEIDPKKENTWPSFIKRSGGSLDNLTANHFQQ